MMKERCGECVYFLKVREIEGKCRRYPPSASLGAVGRFPVVLPSNWCGEFTAVEEYPEPAGTLPSGTYRGAGSTTSLHKQWKMVYLCPLHGWHEEWAVGVGTAECEYNGNPCGHRPIGQRREARR